MFVFLKLFASVKVLDDDANDLETVVELVKPVCACSASKVT